MRRLALLAILLSPGAIAQNWALLNPAYKYNYSNDGSDTISNQIFVTHIDTLGVDSFRYELNTIARICDTCTGPGIHVWTNGAQFVQRTVNLGYGVWHFHDPGSFVILTGASLGVPWTFDTLANVQAVVSSIDTVDQFGSEVARKTIDLSNGSTIRFSEAYGILSWDGNELIGVHGPELGRLIPSITGFFPYGPGDIFQYSWGDVSCHPCLGQEGTFKYTVADSTGTDTSITYAGDRLAFTHHHQTDWNYNTTHWYTYENGPTDFIAGCDELPFFDLVRSHPGQFIEERPWASSAYGSWLGCIARHGIGENGAYRISSDTTITQSHFFIIQPTQTDYLVICNPWDQASLPEWPNGVLYEGGSGLIRYRAGYFDGYEEYYLDGTVINGDTTGNLLTDDQILAVVEPEPPASFKIHPNPANEQLTVTGPASTFTWRILPITGASLLPDRASGAVDRSIDVSALTPGPYVLELVTSTGVARQRFTIAR